VTEPIRPITRREPAPIDPVPKVRLLTPAEREEARRQREALRKRRAAKERSA
jgi:hypothetical protein